MPAPVNRWRYLGVVRTPTGEVSRELFRSVKEAREEVQNRHRTGHGRRMGFIYSALGFTIDPDSLRESEVEETLSPGSTVELHRVHRDFRVEPLPQFKVLLNPRGGTTSLRLKEGTTRT